MVEKYFIPSLIVSKTFASIDKSGVNPRFIYVVADETNGGIPTLYIFDGNVLHLIATDGETDTPFYDLINLKKNIQNIVSGVSTKQLKWLVFGDSMAGTKTNHIFNNLSLQIGYAGAVNFGNNGGVTVNLGTSTLIQDYSVFPFSFNNISVGNFLSLGIGGVSPVINYGKVYLLNNGATYTIKINGVAVAGQTNITLPTNNAITIITLNPTLGQNLLTIEANTGSVKLLSVGLMNTTISGLVPFYLAEGGNDMSNWIGNTQCLANLNAIITDINPDVISYDMKEIVTGFDTRLNTLLTNFITDAPNAELLLFTQTPTQLTNDDMIANNVAIKKISKEKKLSIFDTYKYFKGWNTLNSLGWGGDGVHPSDYANQFLASEFLKEFRLLSIPNSQGQVVFNNITNSTKFVSGSVANRQMQMFIEPTFRLSGVIKVPQMLAFTNPTGTTNVQFDLDDGTNGSDGTQSILPFMFRLGSNGGRIRNNGGVIYIMDGSAGGSTTNNLGVLITKDLGFQNIYTYGNDLSTYVGAGYRISKTYNATGNVIFGNENLGAFIDIPCAMVNVQSTTKGFLCPRMTTAQINSISSPVEGLQAYNTDLHTICFYNGSSWQKVTSTAM